MIKLKTLITEDTDNPKCLNCQYFESGGGHKGYCALLTPPEVVQEGWCKYWSHWSADPPRFQSNLIRKNMRVSKSTAKYTNRAPTENVND